MTTSFLHIYSFAYSIDLVSLITFIFICPGYSSSFSTRFTIFLAIRSASSSLTLSGFTIIRISLPACIAKDFSTPAKELAISSSFSKRLIYNSNVSLLAPGRAADMASAACTSIAVMGTYGVYHIWVLFISLCQIGA